MEAVKRITPRGTDEEILIKFEKATRAIDKEAAKVKADSEKFQKSAQEKRRAGFPEEAIQFEVTRDKLECKWNGLCEALRIIKKHVE